MYLPRMNRISTTPVMQSIFYGLNRQERAGEGQAEDETNMTAAGYPVLMPRKRRSVVTSGAIHGIAEKGAPVWIKGSKVYINSDEVEGVTLSELTTMQPKQLVSMGALVVIFPDKVWINTQQPTQYGNLEQTNTVTTGTVTFKPCMADGTEYDLSDAYIGDSAPTDPEYLYEGAWWIDTSSVPHGLYRYSTATGEWSGLSATYIRIGGTGIGTNLQVYDGITLSGITIDDVDVKAQLEGLNGAGRVVYGAGTNYIVVAGILHKTVSWTLGESQSMSAARTVPDFSYVCELDNRLWGCRYGMVNGEIVNEICASALGDPKVWERYMGNSTDSYRVSVGSDGVFTAITAHLGYVLAWKEDCVHKIYGSQPSSFQLTTLNCEGVQAGSWQSVTDVNGVLMYKGRAHVLAYDGSIPAIVSGNLGETRYSDAAGGCIGDVYYISMRKADGAYELLTFDTKKYIWHREDAVKAKYFTRIGDSLLFARATATEGTWEITDAMGIQNAANGLEGDVAWEVTFGPVGYNYPNRKYLGRYNIRCTLPAGSWLEVWMQFDSEGEWVKRHHEEGRGKTNTVLIPVRPRRCDHVRLRLKGKGDVKIFSVARVLEVGGDGA